MGDQTWGPLEEFLAEYEPGRAPAEGDGRSFFDSARASVTTYGSGIGLLEGVAFLRVVGTPEELEAEHGQLREAYEAVDAALRDRLDGGYWRASFYSEVAYGEIMDAPQERGQELLESMEELGRYLEAARAEAQRVIDALHQDGLDYRDGRLYVTDTGGRPRKVLSDVVVAVWEGMRPKYREETGDSSWTAGELLGRIRGALSRVFPPEELTDSKIKSAIEAHAGADDPSA